MVLFAAVDVVDHDEWSATFIYQLRGVASTVNATMLPGGTGSTVTSSTSTVQAFGIIKAEGGQPGALPNQLMVTSVDGKFVVHEQRDDSRTNQDGPCRRTTVGTTESRAEGVATSVVPDYYVVGWADPVAQKGNYAIFFASPSVTATGTYKTSSSQTVTGEEHCVPADSTMTSTPIERGFDSLGMSLEGNGSNLLEGTKLLEVTVQGILSTFEVRWRVSH